MIINDSGGAQPLNFKVLGGTAEPVSPAENTIWVNTESEITSWVFSATEPTDATEGLLWFNTGNTAAAPFNALKKNNLTVYPATCRQYVSGAWQIKTARTYQGGTWKDWRCYIYNKGEGGDDLVIVSNHNASFAHNADHIKLYAQNSGYSSYFVFQNLNIGNKYRTAYINVTSVGKSSSYKFDAIFAIASGATSTSFKAEVYITEPGLVALDISNVNGGYVAFRMFGATMTFDTIYLE